MTISSTSSSRAQATIASPGPAMPEPRSRYSARVSCSSCAIEQPAEVVSRGVACDLERARLGCCALALVRRQHLEDALRLERRIEILGIEHVQQEQLGAELARECHAVLDCGSRRLAEVRRYEDTVQRKHGALDSLMRCHYPTPGIGGRPMVAAAYARSRDERVTMALHDRRNQRAAPPLAAQRPAS